MCVLGPLVDLLSHCDIVSDSEALVYGMGTVKLLASNDDLRPQLADNGALSLLQSLLTSCLQLVCVCVCVFIVCMCVCI